MKVLLLGVGMQGKAALYDLLQNDPETTVVAADLDYEGVVQFVASLRQADRVVCESLDAGDLERLNQLMSPDIDVVIDLLPAHYNSQVAWAAVGQRVNLVNASYTGPDGAELDNEARSQGLTILPEFGLDPGLDLVLLGDAVRSFDVVEEIWSYGAGIPEIQATGNPLNYKVSWVLEGVLRSYVRGARLIRDGRVIDIPGNHLFQPDNIHEVEIDGVGKLEAYPNGDALFMAERTGLDADNLNELGRFTLRWPGHSEIWRKLVDLHLLDDDPVFVDDRPVDRIRFLSAAIEPHIQYGPNERDLAFVRVVVCGTIDGEKRRLTSQVLDVKDNATGFSAMSRTVGFTASIGAQLIASGQIAGPGVLNPLIDIPLDLVAGELGKRGIQIETTWNDR